MAPVLATTLLVLLAPAGAQGEVSPTSGRRLGA